MRNRPTILYFGPVGRPVPELVRTWAAEKGFPVETLDDPGQVESIILRGHPCFLIVDGNAQDNRGMDLVAQLKADSFTAIVPALVLGGPHQPARMQGLFAAGVDEILTDVLRYSPEEIAAIKASGATEPPKKKVAAAE